MAKYEIKIQTTGGDQSAAEIKKTTDAFKSNEEQVKRSGAETDKLTGKKKKLLDGFKALGQQFPIFGALLQSLRNPLALIGLAGVAAFNAIRKAIGEAHEEQKKWNSYASNLQVSITAYKDLAEATRQLVEAQKALKDPTKNITDDLEDQADQLAENVNQEVRVLEAQKDLIASRIELNIEDPVAKARALKNNELSFGSKIAGLKASLPGKQAGLVDQQITAEKQLQVEAGEGVPNEADLLTQVRGVQANRTALEAAGRINRTKSQRAELLRLASREGADADVLGLFNKGQIDQLAEEGVINDKLRIVPGVAAGLLAGADAESKLARGRVAGISASLRAGIGALPDGAARFGVLEDEGLVSAFVNQAEGRAAETQNSSYGRELSLTSRGAQLRRQQTNEAAVSAVNLETARVKGDIEINRADIEALKEFTEALRQSARDLRNIRSREHLSTPGG